MLYGEVPAVQTSGGDLRGVTVRVPNPPKSAVLRLPTAAEILQRVGQQKSIRRNMGRRKSRTEFIPNFKADLDLFLKIRQDKDGPEFDEFEASNAISKLIYCNVTSCDRAGEEYEVKLETPFGDTVHWLRIPTQRDITMYRRMTMSVVELPYGQEELRFHIGPAVELYDSVASKIEGYSESYKPADVPPHHKQQVVVELLQAIDDLDPAIDPNS